MNGWMDGWMDGWMNVLMDELKQQGSREVLETRCLPAWLFAI